MFGSPKGSWDAVLGRASGGSFFSHVPSNSDTSEKKCLQQLQEAIFLFRNSDLSKLDLLSQCWMGICFGGPQGALGACSKTLGAPEALP